MDSHKNLLDIPHYKNWQRIEYIDKGWSTDKKYYIEARDGQKLLLRLADISEYEKKKAEFETVERIYELGINMSRPIDFGVCAHDKMVYMLLSWLEGESAEDVLPKLSEHEQYDFGFTAGQMLKKIHSIAAPEDQPDWEMRIRRKVEVKLSQYKDCGYTVPNDKKILQFIYDNLKYLKGRPQTLQHGDYHTGNLIINSDKILGVIDFNRSSFGDPWEEFNRLMVFSRGVSIPFAKGQINGYFDNNAPDLFFRLMALYTAINAHFSIIWSIPFGKEEIQGDLARARMNFDDYNGFETYIPVWYK